MTEIDGETTGQFGSIPDEDGLFLDVGDDDVVTGIFADEASLIHQNRRIERRSRRYFSRKRQDCRATERRGRLEVDAHFWSEFEGLSVAEQRRFRSPPSGDDQRLFWNDDMTLSRLNQGGVRRGEWGHESEVPSPARTSDPQLTFETDQKGPSPIDPEHQDRSISGGGKGRVGIG